METSNRNLLPSDLPSYYPVPNRERELNRLLSRIILYRHIRNVENANMAFVLAEEISILNLQSYSEIKDEFNKIKEKIINTYSNQRNSHFIQSISARINAVQPESPDSQHNRPLYSEIEQLFLSKQIKEDIIALKKLGQELTNNETLADNYFIKQAINSLGEEQYDRLKTAVKKWLKHLPLSATNNILAKGGSHVSHFYNQTLEPNKVEISYLEQFANIFNLISFENITADLIKKTIQTNFFNPQLSRQNDEELNPQLLSLLSEINPGEPTFKKRKKFGKRLYRVNLGTTISNVVSKSKGQR